jgi:hypothetical protein
MSRTSLVVVAIAAASCGRDPAAPSLPVSTAPLSPPGAPVLLEPAPGAVIPQTGEASGCAFHPSGFGHRIVFDWAAPASAAGVESYEIHAQGPSATIPIVSTRVVASEHVYLACGSYVADRNLEGWVWRVRAVDLRGQTGEWAEGRFSYAPCRTRGRPCSS